MTTVQQALDFLEAWAGYRDNRGAKVWAKYAPVNYEPASYCGAGQGMVCKELSLELDPTTHPRIIYVPYVVLDAREQGTWIYSKDSKPGDWVCFCWDGGYHGQDAYQADHIGMIVSNNPSLSYVYTAEFNTTANGSGQRGFFYRRRSRSFIMGCVNRSDAYTGKGATPLPPKKPKQNKPTKPAKLKVDGIFGNKSTAAVFYLAGVHSTRLVISGQPHTIRTSHQVADALDECWPTFTYGWGGSQSIAWLQRQCGAKADGYAGPGFWAKWQHHVGVTADRVPGYGTTKATQRWINKQLEKG